MDKMLILQATLFTVIGGLTPLGAALLGSEPLTWRYSAGVVILGLIGAAGALKAFLSTTFASSPSSKPFKAILD